MKGIIEDIKMKIAVLDEVLLYWNGGRSSYIAKTTRRETLKEVLEFLTKADNNEEKL